MELFVTYSISMNNRKCFNNVFLFLVNAKNHLHHVIFKHWD